MARPRSEDKRQAILTAAIGLFAEEGLAAPTARIAKAARVAEGTFFTYFASKDELLNQLYLALKAELRGAVMPAYPAKASVKERSRHAWRTYVLWGAAHPGKRRVMAQLGLCDRISDQTRAEGMEAFCDLQTMLEESAAQGALRDLTPAFVAAVMVSLADATMDFMVRHPAAADRYNTSGFEAFWNAIAKA